MVGGLFDVDCNNFAFKKVVYFAEISCLNDVTVLSLEELCSGSGVIGIVSYIDGERYKFSEEKIGLVEFIFDVG